ncbi:cupin fold metalloprotein, WbuC family [Geobacter sp. FeAm09]|uniref:WbuC family cupin fold metalloprotein n=1 Tax=Geobacter sp. FeAm09 TaxID=2597769 RepID=UPI0011EBB55C|nr:WbuC family cupin fold metalloprotein [Geobacter sp. FeAm09]QEM69463.1 cupin fold metalloprotein, WbuC family [Geobacter sp. FeAm09]
MKIVTTDLLRQLSEQARTSPRLRKNHNIHRRDESRCHRLLNAVEPATYIRPHRHLDPEKDEAFILMSGTLGIVTFADDGAVAETVLLSREQGTLAADIPSGTYHTAVSLEPGTVFYEAKAGPYLPLGDAEKAAWAPGDDEPGAPAYLERLRELFTR